MSNTVSATLGARGHLRLPLRDHMRVPENALRSVGFVSEVVHTDANGQEELDHFATGFFVSVQSTLVPHMTYFYFVTAKHVVRHLAGHDIRFIVNKKGGGVKQFEGVGNTFWSHPTDEAADVAVLPVWCEPDMDIVYVPTNNFLTPEVIKKNRRVGIGDEVFIAGLFTYAPGIDRVMPLIRHGNLAMIPEQQIQTDLGFADVYLIEARSIGGISGSPVFVRPSVLLASNLMEGLPGGRVEPTLGTGGTEFLGLIHGHWDIRESELNHPKIAHALHGVNLGVAIVTPAFKIIETLNRTELIAMREAADRKYNESISPRMD
jgi:hypothetical protein